MSDALGYLPTLTPVAAPEPETAPAHDLSTPRGRLLYLRDVVVPGIPVEHLDMQVWDCGTQACLCGFAGRDENMRALGFNVRDPDFHIAFFGLKVGEWRHLFSSGSYPGSDTLDDRAAPTHDELRAHINDVLEGRVK